MNSERKREIIDAEPEAGTYRATYAYPSEPPSIAVPLAVREVADCEVTDLDPLYEAANVDPDALDEVFRPGAGGTSRDCHLTFTYHDYEVTVKSYGRIVVRSPAARQKRTSD